MGIRARLRALVAALTSKTSGGSNYIPGVGFATSASGWEVEAVEFYDIVPELRYGISWIAQSASRARLIVAKEPEHPAEDPLPIDEDALESAPLYELAPTLPEQATLIEEMVTLLKLVGRWRNVGFDDPLTGRRRWMVLSEREISEVGGDLVFRHPDTCEEMRLSKASVWSIPMWKSHPVWTHLPDSPVRSLIDTLHELVDLSGHVQTAARSRLAGAGLLLMPASLKPVTPGQSTGVNPPKGDPAMRALMRTAQASFRSPQDISRHLPVIFQGQQEALNAVRHLTLNTPFDERVDELRRSAVRRIAIGLDIPPEVIVGMGELNHWTAYQVSADAQKINIAPTLQFVCQQLTRKYLRPALRALGVADYESYMVWYDDSALALSPNRAPEALEAYNIGLINGDAARSVLGFGPADKPAPGEVPPAVALKNATGPSGGGEGQARANGTQTQVQVDGAAQGWIAAADIAARRALGRAGQYLLGAGGRSMRGKYRDVDIHAIHTKVTPGDDHTVDAALRGAFTELEAAAPVLVEPVTAYTRQRLTTGTAHDPADLVGFISSYKGE